MISSDVRVRVDASLRRLLRDGLARPRAHRDGPLVGTTIAVPVLDPLAVFRCGAGHERFFWEQRMDGVAFVAIGSTVTLTGDGNRRFGHIASSWRRLLADAAVETAGPYPFAAPVCLGGFAFDGGRQRDPEWRSYGDALLIVPQILFTWSQGSCWLSVNALASAGAADLDPTAGGLGRLLDALAHAGSQLPRHGGRAGARDRGSYTPHMPGAPVSGDADDDDGHQWKRAVSTIAADVGRGRIEKQVLARRVHLQCPGGVDPTNVLERLRARYGAGCAVFAVSRADSCFVGASPERLVRADGRAVRADAVAGSAPRGRGSRDAALGLMLRADPKERHEHEVVVRAIRDALAPRLSGLTVSPEPALLRMPNVQHLHSVVAGLLRDQADIFELVSCLHPTPACGGTPRDGILERIRIQEAFDRGWYAGPVGWVDRGGSGEFAVAIRSALLRQSHDLAAHATEAILYAGCGIVAGSNPDAEYQESSLKLLPLLEAIGASHNGVARPTEVARSWHARRSV